MIIKQQRGERGATVFRLRNLIDLNTVQAQDLRAVMEEVHSFVGEDE